MRAVWLMLVVVWGCVAVEERSLPEHVGPTDIAGERDRRLLVFSTLDGHLYGVERDTGTVRWKIKDRAVVRGPRNSEQTVVPLFLPNPHDGSLYLVGGEREPLKKLPFTIPELVRSSPCRSTDGILYTGKKKDTWFTLDPTTGHREQILGWDSPNGPTCPVQNADAVYIGRTDYSILMVDSKHINRKWNVSFYEYTAMPISKESLSSYDMAHFTSSSTGYIITMDRRRATVLWESDLGSPIVSAYILDTEGLISLPFTSLSNHSLDNFASNLLNNEPSQNNQQKLYPTLYIGEHPEGLYALPSFIDQNIITLISPGQKPLLLAGPDGTHVPQGFMEYPLPGHNYHIPAGVADDPLVFQSVPDTWSSVIQFGHYELPEYSRTKLQITGNSRFFSKLITDESGHLGSRIKEIRTDPAVHGQPNGRWSGVKYLLTTVLTPALVLVGVYVFQKNHRKGRAFTDRTSSLDKPTGDTSMEVEELTVSVGKIRFRKDRLLGKGCDGTFVYRGEFDGRSVAVKRLLPDCFSFADREVSLLRESDAHPNVIRYFCTEQDSLFKYIALELCQATLCDYVEDDCLRDVIMPLEILQQATSGLEHLHTLNIVHRDIKPQNVLLSLGATGEKARAMISDFGLCKKLQVGRTSFSRRSGVTGTDGWIAPEMLNKSKSTTCAVDMFSLGCLYYYVLSGGDHPFGDPLRRQANISSGEWSLKKFDCSPWRAELYKPLVKSLISPHPQRRPSCRAVLSYPIFWNNATVLAFLQDVSDRIETSTTDDPALSLLEAKARVVVKGNWRSSIDDSVADDLKKYRSYKGNCLRDLLRALRNKKHHFRELDRESQRALGEIPDGFTEYWTGRFPLLLVHTWFAMQILSTEETFRQYYAGHNHTYSPLLIDYGAHEADVCEYRPDIEDAKFANNRPKGKGSPKVEPLNVGLYRNHTVRPSGRKKPKEAEAPLVWVLPSDK